MEQGRTAELVDSRENSSSPQRPRVDLLSEIAGYWWMKRWLIARTLVAAMILFMGLLLLVPKLYRAEATIMIVPPRFLPEQRPEALSVNTARNLLGTGELLQQLLTTLRQGKTVLTALSEEAGAARPEQLFVGLASLEPEQIMDRYGPTIVQNVQQSEAETSGLAVYLSKLSVSELHTLTQLQTEDLDSMTVQDLAESLESEDIIEKKTATDVRFSPLLKLYAVSDSGAKAQLFANTWARLFERMYARLTTEKTTTQFESIRKQQQQNQLQLDGIQTEIVDFKENNNLELIQKQIDEYSNDYSDFSRQLSLKRNALDAEGGRLEELQRLAESMEHEETWVGRVDVAIRTAEEAAGLNAPLGVSAITTNTSGEIVRSTSTTPLQLSVTPEQVASAMASTSVLPGEAAGSEYDRIRTQAVQSRDRLAGAILELNEFHREQPLQLIEKERDQLQIDYLQAWSKLRVGQVRREVLRKSVKDLDTLLSSTLQFLTLNIGVPPEAIANQVAAGSKEDIGRLQRLEFARQEINPEWASFAVARVKLIEELQLLESEVQTLTLDLPSKEKQLRDLQDTIYRVTLSEKFMQENLERWQKTNEELFDLYVDTNNSIASTARQVKLLEVEVQNMDHSTSITKAQVEESQQLYNQAAAHLASLESRLRAVQRQGDVLLQKLQDAQIAMSGDISDVSVAAAAVAPSKHFFPRRSVLTIAFGLFSAALMLSMLARSRYLQLQQQGAA